MDTEHAKGKETKRIKVIMRIEIIKHLCQIYVCKYEVKLLCFYKNILK